MGLFDAIGGGNVTSGANRPGSGIPPLALAVIGALAYKALKGKGRLADMAGGTQAQANPAAPGASSAAPSAPAAGAAGLGSAGGLGGLLGGLGGGGLGAGLKDLLDRFRQTGHEDKAQSWVSTGANRPIEPHELEQALGADRIQWLMEQTGLPRDQLLSGLSRELPNAVDKLTPNGQVPSDEALEQQLRH